MKTTLSRQSEPRQSPSRGVTCFFPGLVHAASGTNPISSIFVSSPLTKSAAGVPFQPFGFFTLVILFLMAAASRGFWLANLTAPIWKTPHRQVYVAYALLLLHVTFGVLQAKAVRLTSAEPVEITGEPSAKMLQAASAHSRAASICAWSK